MSPYRLPCVNHREVLGALFPLQERVFSRAGEIVHAALTLQALSSQESILYRRCEGREMDVSKVRGSPISSSSCKGLDRILSLTQMVKVVRHPKPGIGIGC